MKKRFMFLVLTLGLLFAIASTANADPKASWKAVKGTPTVDGQKDAAYDNSQIQRLTAVSDGSTDGTSADAWTLYDDKNIYFFVQVKDKALDDTAPSWYERDGVEIRIPDSTQGVNFYAVSGKKEAQYGDGNFVTEYKVVKTSDGYNVEFMVPFDTSKGNVKFALQVDCAAGGARNCTLHTNEDLANAWQDDSVFETLVFSTETSIDNSAALAATPAATTTVAPATPEAKPATPAKKATKKAAKKVTKKAKKAAKKAKKK